MIFDVYTKKIDVIIQALDLCVWEVTIYNCTDN